MIKQISCRDAEFDGKRSTTWSFCCTAKNKFVHVDSDYTESKARCSYGAAMADRSQVRRIKAMPECRAKRAIEKLERRKASLRADVEHPFHVIQRQLGLMKVRFRGLGEEHRARRDAVRPVESVYSAPSVVGDDAVNGSEQGGGMR